MNPADMSKDELLLEVQALRSRVTELEHYADGRGSPPQSDQEDLPRLQNVLEELRVAEEELRQQNEELALSREAEEQLRQLFQGLFEFAPDGYIVTDTSGAILRVNCSAVTMLDMQERYLVGKPLILFIGEGRRKAFHSLLSQLMHSERIHDWEAPMQANDGTHFYASITVSALHDAHGAVTRVCWLIHDITERKRMEEALEEAKLEAERRAAELKAVFESMNDPVLVYDANGTLLRTNAALKKFYGLDPDGAEWDKQFGTKCLWSRTTPDMKRR
jgi:PAS domain S-box-containing protein